MSHQEVALSQLGKETIYADKYNPALLYPISRPDKSHTIYGYDMWNLYELSWLNCNNKPEVALGCLFYDANSPKLIESKSLKLYLNSFNNSQLSDIKNIIISDLSNLLQTQVILELHSLDDLISLHKPKGICIDNMLSTEGLSNENFVSEVLYSNLLRSNCPITNQPDWGTITVEYQGIQIDKYWLLQHIISYRNHNDFHENCVETIYSDLMDRYNFK